MAADESAGKEGRLYTFGSLKTGEGLYCQSTFCVLKGRFFAQYRDELDEVGCHIILVILRLPSNSPNRSTKTYGKMSEMCKLSVCYQIERSFLTRTLFTRTCSYNASYLAQFFAKHSFFLIPLACVHQLTATSTLAHVPSWQIPLREGVLDGCMRLEDTGRKTIGNQARDELLLTH